MRGLFWVRAIIKWAKILKKQLKAKRLLLKNQSVKGVGDNFNQEILDKVKNC